MLSLHGQNLLTNYLAQDLAEMGANICKNPDCLCRYYSKREEIAKTCLENVDVVVYHPARDYELNSLQCWETHKTIIEANPQKRFYVFALFSPQIEDFLGMDKNIQYFREGNVKAIFNELRQLAKPISPS